MFYLKILSTVNNVIINKFKYLSILFIVISNKITNIYQKYYDYYQTTEHGVQNMLTLCADRVIE